jgi:hypothetical protein
MKMKAPGRASACRKILAAHHRRMARDTASPATAARRSSPAKTVSVGVVEGDGIVAPIVES